MRKIISFIISAAIAASATAQTFSSGASAERKQLVVAIVVDQLRSDQLTLLADRFSDGGFLRLLKNGAYFENVNFDIPDPDLASSTAILFSGTYPSVNGIPSERIYNPQTRRDEPVLTDRTQIGNFTTENFSPAALKVSTVTDELRADNSLCSVHAIAADPQMAILMAGHAANSAFWICDANGNWASTAYYKLTPPIVAQINRDNPLSARIDSMEWSPVLPLTSYIDLTEMNKYIPFKHKFGKSDINRFKKIKNTPLANQLVTDLALDMISSLALGRHSSTDMICLGYSTATFRYSDDPDTRVETQDTYIRLDQQLARLFNAIDNSIGLDNTLVILTSTGYFDDQSIPDERLRIPTGEYYPERGESLLNMYLMAIYGNGQWVDTYYDRAFYLNRNLIKEKDLDLSEVRAKSCEFLRQMTGISAAYTFEEILNNPSNEEAHSRHRSMVHSLAPDIFIEVNPGWKIVENTVGKKQDPKVTAVRHNAISAPCFIMANEIEPQHVATAVDATAIAPTLSKLMHISPPNAARQMPLPIK